jgi:hypothetical protein
MISLAERGAAGLRYGESRGVGKEVYQQPSDCGQNKGKAIARAQQTVRKITLTSLITLTAPIIPVIIPINLMTLTTRTGSEQRRD